MNHDERLKSADAEERMLALMQVRPSLVAQIPIGYFDDAKRLMAYLTFKKAYEKFNSLHKSFITEVFSQDYDEIRKELDDYNGMVGAGSFDELMRFTKVAKEEYAHLPEKELDEMVSTTQEILHRLYAIRKLADDLDIMKRDVISGKKSPLQAYTRLGESIINPRVIPQNFYDHINEMKNSETSEPIYSGNSRIDENTGGYRRGNIILWSGDTGSMKTIAAMWHIRDILKTNPTFKCVIFQKEMPVEDMILRELSHISSTNDSLLHDKRLNDSIALAETEETIRQLYERIYFVPFTNFDNVQDMWAYMNAIKPDVWMLDFVQLLGSSNKGNEVYEDLAKQIKFMTMETNSLGLIISQLKSNSVETRNIKIPHLDDVLWINVLKQLTSYAYMTFLPSKYMQDTVPANYYYLINKKNRFAGEFWVPLRAMAETKDFSSKGTVEIEKWYTTYTKPKFQKLAV